MEESGQLHAPAALPLGKEPQVTLLLERGRQAMLLMIFKKRLFYVSLIWISRDISTFSILLPSPPLRRTGYCEARLVAEVVLLLPPIPRSFHISISLVAYIYVCVCVRACAPFYESVSYRISSKFSLIELTIVYLQKCL
jgi:hypothetical protein